MDPDYCSSRGDDHWEHNKQLIAELTQGRELARQLQVHINSQSSSHQTRELLIHKILGSYEKLLSILACNTTTSGSGNGNGIALVGEPTGATSESQRSFSGSEDSDRDFRDFDLKDSPMKRKSNGGSMQKWKQQVRVNPDKAGLEGFLDDGYSWRKYGQKDILGAKYPRGYYRCAYRLIQGCFATKQVQRSDDDPNTIEITYRGQHTCNPGSVAAPPPPLPTPPPPPPPEIQEPSLPELPEILLNFQTSLTVMPENLDSPTCHLPSASKTNIEDHVMPPPITLDNDFQPTSAFPLLSPPQVDGSNRTPTLFGLESELNKIVSVSTSSTSSRTLDLGFPFGELKYDQNVTFEDSSRF